MIKLKVEIDENKLKSLVIDYLNQELSLPVTEKDVLIQVKSSQNYKSEWESAQFRATINKAI